MVEIRPSSHKTTKPQALAFFNASRLHAACFRFPAHSPQRIRAATEKCPLTKVGKMPPSFTRVLLGGYLPCL